MSLQSNRRTFATAVSAAVVAGAVAPQLTYAQATPVADEDVLELSQRLVAMGDLDAAHVPELATLVVTSDPDGTAFRELQAMTEFSLAALDTATEPARNLAKNILQFWYLGQWEGVSVESTPDRFFELSCWDTVPYPTQPSLCKAFGYWTQPVDME
jgi:hypothetical protein